MLVAALVLAFVAFVAFVGYIATGADWTLFCLYAAAGLGIILFIVDWWVKHRRDAAQTGRDVDAATTAIATNAAADSARDAEELSAATETPTGELPDPGETKNLPGLQP